MPTSYANFILISPGAFIAGLIVPREGGLAIMITEKLEDMVSIIFLPLVGYSL
jgi:Kef-type K+ transport system membrane component KefB